MTTTIDFSATSPMRTRVASGDVSLSVVDVGAKDAPCVILLHGFPEMAFGWRHQAGVLVDAGFRVLIPDQRGFGESDKPRAVRAYHLDTLVDDVAALVQHAGVQKAHIVGHDWGAAVAWWVALTRPALVDKLVVMNAPHPTVFERALRHDGEQRRRSWYMLMFQLPFFPERLLTNGNGKILQRTSNRGSFSDHDVEEYVRAWKTPGTARGMMNWYRAIRYRPRATDIRVRVPTMIVWGKKDHALKHEMATASLTLCDDGRLEFLDDATHWVQHDDKERVNALLLSFLSSGH